MGRGARVDGEGFAGFPAGALATAVPSAFFTDILPQVESAEEMLVSVYFCFLQTLPANRRRPLSVAELRADGGLRRALATGRLAAAPESEPPPAPEAPPNIFRLYEDNIGPITPLLAEELAEAEHSFPGSRLEEPLREAVSL